MQMKDIHIYKNTRRTNKMSLREWMEKANHIIKGEVAKEICLLVIEYYKNKYYNNTDVSSLRLVNIFDEVADTIESDEI